MDHRPSIPLVFWPIPAALLLISPGSGVLGQTAGDGALFDSVEVEVESIEVVVTDSEGHPVSGLDRSDFRLLVDGREVPITNFYAEAGHQPAASVLPPESSSSPLGATDATAISGPATRASQRAGAHFVVVVDNSNLGPTRRKKVFESLRRFLGTELATRDPVSLVTLDQGAVKIRSEFETDRKVLGSLLDQMQKDSGRSTAAERERKEIFGSLSRRVLSLDAPDALLSRIRTYAQTKFIEGEATLETLGRHVTSLEGVPGRKALIFVSDGVANRPGEGLFLTYQERFGGADYPRAIGTFDLLPRFKALARQANASGVTLYSIDAIGDHAAAVRDVEMEGGVAQRALSVLDVNYREPMESAAVATGGRWIPGGRQLAEALQRIAADFTTFYSLGFSPIGPNDENWHRIEVELVRRGGGADVKRRESWTVRHRETFESRSNDRKAAQTAQATLLYNTIDNALGAQVELGSLQPSAEADAQLSIQVSVPLRELVLLPYENGQLASQVSIFVTVKNKAEVPGLVRKLSFRSVVSAQKETEARQQLAHFEVPAHLWKGDRQIAFVVRDDFGATQSTLRFDL